MKIREVLDYLEAQVPLTQQEDWDNSGVQVGDTSQELKGILIAIDTTVEIVEEAIQHGCNLIVTHHPLLFRATKQITPEYYIFRALMLAIKHDIVIYASHTSLDNDDYGVNQYWAKKMGLRDAQPLLPTPGFEHNPLIGAGVIGNLEQPMSLYEVLDKMKQFQPITQVSHSKVLKEPIQCIAYCGGSGSFLMQSAMQAGAELFITGEAKYNDFYDAQDLLTLMTIGHFESEELTKDLLHNVLSEKCVNFAVRKATRCENPVKYTII